MTDSLYGRLKELENSDFYPFHMPGHKRNVSEGTMPVWYSTDITEIEGFDNLHQPQGILLHSQEKAAALYRTDKTYFLINGSTAGILSAISATAVKGKKLLIARNSHMSVYHGGYLNDLAFVYLYPKIDENYGIAAGIRGEDVAAVLKAEKAIGAVLITSPTYEGMVSEVREIAAATHEYGIPLIVDEAHGAHFGFHPGYPENAVSQGADIVIHSLHKTLPAPTQTALLHIQGGRIDRRRLERYLRIFQSSSPSYPLMGGIDLCLDLLRKQGREMMDGLLRMRHAFAAKVKDLRYLQLLSTVDDPAKLVIFVNKGIPFDGCRLAEVLRDKYHLEMEMAAEGYVVAIITAMDRPEGLNRLAQALGDIDRTLSCQTADAATDECLRDKPEKDDRLFYRSHLLELKTVMGIREALEQAAEEVVPAEAVNRIAAEFILLYPPGIPLAVPGEKLSREVLNTIGESRQAGRAVHGLTTSGTITVCRNA